MCILERKQVHDQVHRGTRAGLYTQHVMSTTGRFFQARELRIPPSWLADFLGRYTTYHMGLGWHVILFRNGVASSYLSSQCCGNTYLHFQSCMSFWGYFIPNFRKVRVPVGTYLPISRYRWYVIAKFSTETHCQVYHHLQESKNLIITYGTLFNSQYLSINWVQVHTLGTLQAPLTK